jgi:hypothetical protein
MEVMPKLDSSQCTKLMVQWIKLNTNPCDRTISWYVLASVHRLFENYNLITTQNMCTFGFDMSSFENNLKVIETTM